MNTDRDRVIASDLVIGTTNLNAEEWKQRICLGCFAFRACAWTDLQIQNGPAKLF
jgi:hypothetical protein